MAVFIISVLVIASVMAAMALGVMAGRSPIKGSCGGLGALGSAGPCEICGGDTQRCNKQAANLPSEVKRPYPDHSAVE